MNRIVFLLTLSSILFFLVSCTKVPITGRKQMKLLPKATMNQMSFSSYQAFLSENPVSTNSMESNRVKTVGQRIQKAAEKYFAARGESKFLEGYKWEFNLVQDPLINAWCMPGGKVVVYTGLLPVAKNDDGLAVVMGHEIAHALANHGNERMSQGMATQLGGTALSVALSSQPQKTQQLFNTAYGLGAQVGVLLPFSRKHESEADEIGLILMAMAGYDVNESVNFWKRMAQASGGGKVPDFLSTHPSHQTRITNLTRLIPKAKAYAQRYGTVK